MLKSLFQKISPALIVKEAQAPTHPATAHEQQLAAVCAVAAAEALPRLGTGERGLDAATVMARRRAYGPNEISGSKRASALLDLLRRFRNPLAIQRLVIGAVSLARGGLRSALAVGWSPTGIDYGSPAPAPKAVLP
jgi:magnesium-transporting ATPase (P-type)